jgi:hypothetical protein
MEDVQNTSDVYFYVNTYLVSFEPFLRNFLCTSFYCNGEREQERERDRERQRVFVCAFNQVSSSGSSSRLGVASNL